jgi:hypothetical protein
MNNISNHKIKTIPKLKYLEPLSLFRMTYVVNNTSTKIGNNSNNIKLKHVYYIITTLKINGFNVWDILPTD